MGIFDLLGIFGIVSIVVIVGTLARVSIVGKVETQESNSQPSSAAAATRMVHHSIFGLLSNVYWVLIIGYWVIPDMLDR